MSTTIGVATFGSRPELISATYRRLRRMGFDDPEAANLIALKNGFRITSQPWTLRELAHLLFLRDSCRVGRRWSDADDSADGSHGSRLPGPVDRAPAPPVGDGPSAPAVASKPREDADSADGRVTLLTLFRSVARPNATLDLLRPPVAPRPDAAGDSDPKGG